MDPAMCTSLRYWMVLAFLVTSGCSDDLILPGDASPAALNRVSGNDQEGTVGSRLAIRWSSESLMPALNQSRVWPSSFSSTAMSPMAW